MAKGGGMDVGRGRIGRGMDEGVRGRKREERGEEGVEGRNA